MIGLGIAAIGLVRGAMNRSGLGVKWSIAGHIEMIRYT